MSGPHAFRPKEPEADPALELSASPKADDWFRAFHAEHSAFVRRSVAHLLGGQGSDIEDVCQEVFLVAHRKWLAFALRGADPRGFLRGVSIREVHAHRRWRRVKDLVGLRGAREDRDDRTPETAFADREAGARLYHHLDKLSEKRRTVLILHEIEELSGEEIAGLLQIPVSTVWTRLFHARRALERAMHAQWPERER